MTDVTALKVLTQDQGCTPSMSKVSAQVPPSAHMAGTGREPGAPKPSPDAPPATLADQPEVTAATTGSLAGPPSTAHQIVNYEACSQGVRA